MGGRGESRVGSVVGGFDDNCHQGTELGNEIGAVGDQGGERATAVVFADSERKGGAIVERGPGGSSGMDDGPNACDVPNFGGRFDGPDRISGGHNQQIIGRHPEHPHLTRKRLLHHRCTASAQAEELVLARIIEPYADGVSVQERACRHV